MLTSRHRRGHFIVWILGLAALLAGLSLFTGWRWTTGNGLEAAALPAPELAGENRPVAPLPAAVALPADRVELGRRLFHDKRLSRDNSVACADCHPLDRAGVDGRPVSVGIAGRQGEVNAPTVFNSGFNFRQFWDGRAENLEQQAAGPIHNPLEMDSSWPEVLGKLKKDPNYQRLSQAAFGASLDPRGVASALADFQRSLVTPDSRFDLWLRGQGPLAEQEQRGWRLFQDLGCVACHQGVNLGGNLYANLGVLEDYFAGRPARKSDLGVYNVTGREADKHKFKVPGLRNVARTAPYFHDGSQQNLEQAVETMARYQLGLRIAREDRDAVVAFLRSLTGRYQGRPL